MRNSSAAIGFLDVGHLSRCPVFKRIVLAKAEVMARILIVEDRPIDRKFLSTLLRSEGYEVIETADGAEALRLLRQTGTDLVISDILMPTIDGYEFVRRLRAIPEIAATPVIFYSAVYHEREAHTLAASCGVVDILSKPSEPTVILAKIEAVLAGPEALLEAGPHGLRRFDHDHLQLMTSTFASRFSDFEVSEQRMAAIVDVAHRLASEHDPDVLLNTVCAAAREVTLAQHAVLGVLSDDGATTRALFVSGLDEATTAAMTLPLIRGTPLSAVVNDRQALRQENPEGRPEVVGLPVDHPPVFSRLTVPIASARTVYGWLGLRNKLGADTFTDRDEQIALMLATFAGIAYENARLYQDLRRHSASLEQEIAERKEVERRLAHLADHDGLTGLLNRRRFEETVARETKLIGRYGRGGAVLLMDLDNFKTVNDQFGHQAGDDLLRAIAAVLRRQIRETDVLARLGGDEFGIILPQVNADQAQVVADKIVKVFRHQTAILGHQQIPVTASVGVVLFGHLTAVEVLACADLALYEAKECGRNTFVLYQPDMSSRLPGSQRLAKIEVIRQALDQNRLVLHGQPIVNLGTGEVTQYELLVRLQPQSGPLLAPNAFLHIAERFGMITAIDTWVVRQAVELLAAHARAGRAVTLNVNISAKSIGDPQLVEVVRHALRDSGVDATRLVFELTETAAISDLQNAQRFINQLRSFGCKFALDDFGMGFSSLHYLKYLTFDYLKIDGAFIRDIAVNATDQIVVDAIVTIAKGMGKETIAEFVENAETTNLLRKKRVDYAQGYHIGMPEPVTDVFAHV
jgi:diguanylate cyclase (GGDEF)-like protein